MEFGIKDAIDILLVATLLFYIYRTMKDSGTLNIFIGVLAFIVLWVVVSRILDMRLIGTIMDKFINIGLLILVILFQDQIKQFLIELGSNKRWRFISRMFRRKNSESENKKWIIPVVYAAMSMSKSKTGALIVIQQTIPLDNYIHTGDLIDSKINTRLIENIFFKNSPLHDGALIISKTGLRQPDASCRYRTIPLCRGILDFATAPPKEFHNPPMPLPLWFRKRLETYLLHSKESCSPK